MALAATNAKGGLTMRRLGLIAIILVTGLGSVRVANATSVKRRLADLEQRVGLLQARAPIPGPPGPQGPPGPAGPGADVTALVDAVFFDVQSAAVDPDFCACALATCGGGFVVACGGRGSDDFTAAVRLIEVEFVREGCEVCACNDGSTRETITADATCL